MAESAVTLREAFQTFVDASSKLEDRYAAHHEEVVRLRARITEQDSQLKAAQQLSMLGELAGGLAHEVRTPLASLKLYLSMLVKDLAGTPSFDHVTAMQRSVGTLEATVNNMLLMTKGGSLVKVPMNLSALVRGELADFTKRYPTVTVETSVAEPLVILGNDQALRQVIINLLNNAAQAIGQNGTVRVQLDYDPQRRARLTISDNGPGIDATVLPRLFDPLVSSKQTGHGLGLAVVRRMLEQHKARVTVRSEQGGGAHFEIVFEGSGA